jgi:acetyl-CoA carboxylase biotin carboxyl carrier protein
MPDIAAAPSLPADPVAVGPGVPPSADVPEATPVVRSADAPAAHATPGTPGAQGPTAAPAGHGDGATGVPVPVLRGADASLLALIDRLAGVLEHSDLGELEVAAGGTTIVLRSPAALERRAAPAAVAGDPVASAATDPSAQLAAAPAPSAAAAPAARPSVKAPLTGIFYGAPSPGAMAYVAVGDHVAVGQIIGLIEAMKLFNEIKSDLTGRVVRICVDSGALVKAKQPLIEVEPA